MQNLAETLRIETPAVLAPLFTPSRYKGAFGGRAGTKSHGFADLLIDDCLRQHIRMVCVREVQKTLEQSCKRVIEDKIKAYDLQDTFRILNTHIETPHDGVIIFQGMQDHTAQSIKSLEGFNRAWVEEAQSLSQRSLDLLRPTIFRVADSEIWFSWNPRFETDPVDNFFRGNAPRKVGMPPWSPPPDSILVNPSFRDNPWLSKALIQEIAWDRRRDPDKFAHIWGGGYEKKSEARVFRNWHEEEFETPDDTAFYYGGDWGYSIDPAVLVRCWIKEPKTLYIDGESYEVGCEIDDLPALFDKLDEGKARQWPIVADSARPETISYMQRHGYPRLEAAKKGKDSVKEGVIFLQGYDIVVHPRCQHTIDELTLYSYKVDRLTDKVLPILEDKKNHVIDSLRYALEGVREPGDSCVW